MNWHGHDAWKTLVWHVVFLFIFFIFVFVLWFEVRDFCGTKFGEDQQLSCMCPRALIDHSRLISRSLLLQTSIDDLKKKKIEK